MPRLRLFLSNLIKSVSYYSTIFARSDYTFYFKSNIISNFPKNSRKGTLFPNFESSFLSSQKLTMFCKA